MGLSASQARLLNLTSRMHDIEYKAQNLEAQKLQMANESTAVYQEYEDALNQQKVQLKSVGSDGTAKYSDATFQNLFDAGYTLKVFNPKTGIWATGCTDMTGVKNGSGCTTLTDTSATLSNMVEAGYIVFEKTNADSTVTETNIATDTNLQETSDESNVKKAEAKYEAAMAKIDAKDKKFDTDIASLDNERTAIKTEIDTLKTVAKDNVDRTFKLFS